MIHGTAAESSWTKKPGMACMFVVFYVMLKLSGMEERTEYDMDVREEECRQFPAWLQTDFYSSKLDLNHHQTCCDFNSSVSIPYFFLLRPLICFLPRAVSQSILDRSSSGRRCTRFTGQGM